MTLTTRFAGPADAETLHRFIVALAEYEREPNAVEATPAVLRAQLASERPPFECLLAEREGLAVGFALFFPTYSTWKGRMLYLEDLVVTEAARRGGFGRLLFDTVVAEARATGAVRMKWQVLDWNEPAIGFYKKLGANIESEWLNGNLDAEQLATYVVAPVATTAAAPETSSSL